jgi:hypothetical protein
MNNREHQTITLTNILLTITLVTVLIKLFSWGWRKSKVGTILVITLGPYILAYGPHVFDSYQPIILCEEHPQQPGCIKMWKDKPYIPLKDRIQKPQ